MNISRNTFARMAEGRLFWMKTCNVNVLRNEAFNGHSLNQVHRQQNTLSCSENTPIAMVIWSFALQRGALHSIAYIYLFSIHIFYILIKDRAMKLNWKIGYNQTICFCGFEFTILSHLSLITSSITNSSYSFVFFITNNSSIITWN